MTHTDKYNELRTRINKHCPHLLRLEFGCEVQDRDYASRVTGKWRRDGETFISFIHEDGAEWSMEEDYIGVTPSIEILGIPPTLQDVLRAIGASQNMDYRYLIRADGRMFDEDSEHIDYNLTLPLSEQSEQTLDFLLSVIE